VREDLADLARVIVVAERPRPPALVGLAIALERVVGDHHDDDLALSLGHAALVGGATVPRREHLVARVLHPAARRHREPEQIVRRARDDEDDDVQCRPPHDTSPIESRRDCAHVRVRARIARTQERRLAGCGETKSGWADDRAADVAVTTPRLELTPRMVGS
jgi:hypothetical protein